MSFKKFPFRIVPDVGKAKDAYYVYWVYTKAFLLPFKESIMNVFVEERHALLRGYPQCLLMHMKSASLH